MARRMHRLVTMLMMRPSQGVVPVPVFPEINLLVPLFPKNRKFVFYEGDPRSNVNTSVISSIFGISKNGLYVYYDILSIL